MRFRNAFFCLVVVVGFGLFSGCDRADKPAPMENKTKADPAFLRGTIVCVGDSLTEGAGVAEEQAYPALLKQKLGADGHLYAVINAGISGETSSGTLSRINWILTLKPDIVILETGANDGLRGTDPKLTQKNITEIVRILKAKGVIVLLAGMEMLRNMGTDYTTAFREIYTNVAKEETVRRIPFFLNGVAGNPRLNQPDGIHPTAEGYKVITEKIYPYVLEAIGDFEGGGRQ
ncbi:MAG: arylesterase [Pseudomonadota bacterium]